MYDWRLRGTGAAPAQGGARGPYEAGRAFWLTGFLDGARDRFSGCLNLHLRTLRGLWPGLWVEDAQPVKDRAPLKPTETLFELNIEAPRRPHSCGGGTPPLVAAVLTPPATAPAPSCRLKAPFPDISIRWIFWQLDKYPLISSKFIKYLKLRKIYRICQRKEHLTKTGLIKILSLWRLH